MSGYTQYLGDTNRENIMTVTASYLNDTIRPLVAMTKAVNDWRIDIEHPLVGSIAVTRIGRPDQIIHFYATPGWEGVRAIVVAIEVIDKDGNVDGIEAFDIEVDWSGYVLEDVIRYRLAITKLVESIARGDWRDVYSPELV